MLHFEVRPEHYEGVRKLVTEMDRDMGPDTGNRVVDMRFQNELEFNAAVAKFEASGEGRRVPHRQQAEGEPKAHGPPAAWSTTS
jgi:hypothetical protein